MILLVAAVLRAEAIAGHLSDAEGYSYLIGSAPGGGAFLHRLAAYENTPPLFYLLLTALPLDHSAWLRLPAAIPGTLIPLVLYLALRRPLGVRAALLAAALVAVAPYHVSYSDYSRGFMLSGLGCMFALWAVLRLAEGASSRWWLLYLTGGVLALYSEYDAAIFLVALALSAAVFGQRDRWRTIGLGVLPMLALLPWAHQIARGQDALNHTKISPTFPAPSLSSLREVTVRVVLGEHGAGSSPALRWLEFLALLVVLMAVATILRAAFGREPRIAKQAISILAASALVLLVGHALAPIVGLDLFNERYLTVLIPLGAALASAAVAQLHSRAIWVTAATITALVGVVVFAQRLGREYEPDLAPVRALAATLHPRELLTNSAVVAYYLRHLHPIVDRPFGLGPGLEHSCLTPCVIIDDSRAPGGVRPGPGPTKTVAFFNVRVATDTPSR